MFGESWWARQWIERLESLGLGSRLARGRAYARRGQVGEIQIDPGEVRASVQGSERRPYRVTLRVAALDESAWNKVFAALRSRSLLAAQLLAGEMPEDIEAVFATADTSLFPRRGDDLQTSCSCSDPENPCKHVAAVHYLLSEELDRDPFLLFRLRGAGRAQVVEALGTSVGVSAGADERSVPESEEQVVEGGDAPAPKVRGQSLPSDPTLFWSAALESAEAPVETARSAGEEEEASLVETLSTFPFWRCEEPFLPIMQRLYRAVRRTALGVLAGEH